MESYIAVDTHWQAENFTPKDNYPYVIKHNPLEILNVIKNRQHKVLASIESLWGMSFA